MLKVLKARTLVSISVVARLGEWVTRPRAILPLVPKSMLPKMKRIIRGMKREKKSAWRLRRNIFMQAMVIV